MPRKAIARRYVKYMFNVLFCFFLNNLQLFSRMAELLTSLIYEREFFHITPPFGLSPFKNFSCSNSCIVIFHCFNLYFLICSFVEHFLMYLFAICYFGELMFLHIFLNHFLISFFNVEF